MFVVATQLRTRGDYLGFGANQFEHGRGFLERFCGGGSSGRVHFLSYEDSFFDFFPDASRRLGLYLCLVNHLRDVLSGDTCRIQYRRSIPLVEPIFSLLGDIPNVDTGLDRGAFWRPLGFVPCHLHVERGVGAVVVVDYGDRGGLLARRMWFSRDSHVRIQHLLNATIKAR